MGSLGGHSPLVLTLPEVPEDEQFSKQMAKEPFPWSVDSLPCLYFLDKLYSYSKIQVVVK